ncbi:MAG: hypothetical protein R3314_05715, partial [Longimicrobiales bacterium]|nr:hypothetical protein [Longimicrobiales bacterium]
PQWMVTAVIVAALAGLPVVLVLAWIFEWGPKGLHRTEDLAVGRMEAPPTYDPEGGTRPAPATGPARSPDRSRPWIAAVAVLVVAIGSAVGVAYVLSAGGAGGGEGAAPGVGQPSGDLTRPPQPPLPGEMNVLGPGFADSIQAQITRAFGALDSADVEELTRLGRRAAMQSGLGVAIVAPQEWRGGRSPSPVPLAQGDTLAVRGAAFDTAGIVRVTVDGDTVAEPPEPEETVSFTATVTGRAAAGRRMVIIAILTVDGRELRREFPVIQMPGGVP